MSFQPSGCGFCAMSLCPICIQLGKACHNPERGKSVCSAHSKQFHSFKIEANRVIVTKMTEKEEVVAVKRVSTSDVNLQLSLEYQVFHGFYNEFNNRARLFEIFDNKDMLWKESLEYTYLYVFSSAKSAAAAIKEFRFLEYADKFSGENAAVTDANGFVRFQICSQCNCYQARVPFARTLRVDSDDVDAPQNMLARSFAPNFYSESLCRKPNISHDKKKKGARRKVLSSADLNEKLEQDVFANVQNNPVLAYSENMPLPLLKHTSPFLNIFASPYQNVSQSPFSANVVSLSNVSIGYSNNSRAFSISNHLLNGLKAYYPAPINNHEACLVNVSNKRKNAPESSLFNPLKIGKISCSSETRAELFKKELESFSPFFDSSIPEFQPVVLKDSVSLVFLETSKFDLFRSYVDTFPIDPSVNLLRFCRYEFLRAISFAQELHDREYFHSTPSLPIDNGNLIPLVDLFNLQNSQDSAFSSTVSKLLGVYESCFHEDDSFSNNNSSARNVLLEGFYKHMRVLDSYLTPDSLISLEEPLLYLTYTYYKTSFKEVLAFNYSYPNLIKVNDSFSRLIMESYVFYDKVVNSFSKPEVILSLKHILGMSIRLLGLLSTQTRLWHIRSLFTSRALKCIEKSYQTLDHETKVWIDAVKKYATSCCDDSYLRFENFEYFDSSSAYQIMLQISLSSDEFFAITCGDHKCPCNIIGENCVHKNSKNTSRFPEVDFSLYCMAVYALILLGLENAEEMYTIVYINFLLKLSNSPESDIDAYLKPSRPINCVYPSATLPCVNMCFEDGAIDPYSNFRGLLIVSPVCNHMVLTSSKSLFSNSIKLSPESAQKYLDSFPRSRVYIASSCSIDESLRWIRLAVRVAFVAGDIYSIIYSSQVLIYMLAFIKKDMDSGVLEINKLRNFCQTTLLHLPLRSGDMYSRQNCQCTIVTINSILMQYLQHKSANLTSCFYPGQIVEVKIDGVIYDTVYINFEQKLKPIYLAHIPEVGDCVARFGCDLSLRESWDILHLDITHKFYSSVLSPLVFIRFLLHSFRIGEYTVSQFIADIRLRSLVDVHTATKHTGTL